MSFRNCPKCKECDTAFFQTDEDFGIYEVLECSNCKYAFSPQREEEKYRTLVHRIVFAALGIIAGLCGLQRGDTIVNIIFVVFIMMGWFALMILFTIHMMGDEETETSTSSAGPR